MRHPALAPMPLPAQGMQGRKDIGRCRLAAGVSRAVPQRHKQQALGSCRTGHLPATACQQHCHLLSAAGPQTMQAAPGCAWLAAWAREHVSTHADASQTLPQQMTQESNVGTHPTALHFQLLRGRAVAAVPLAESLIQHNDWLRPSGGAQKAVGLMQMIVNGHRRQRHSLVTEHALKSAM